MEDLQGNIAIQRNLVGEIDGPHPAVADEAFDDEIAEQCAWRCHRFRNGHWAETGWALHDFTGLDFIQFEKGATMVALETHGDINRFDVDF